MADHKTDSSGPVLGDAAAADASMLLELYRTMVLIRRFEERVYELFGLGKVYGSTHLCIGQEAVSAGVASALEDGDRVACTYRGHGHALALGCDPASFMAEMLGRETGTCGGRSGSMNVIDQDNKLIGCFGIVGGSVGAATGAALSLKLKGQSRAAVAFFGDGAMNQAYLHECLNFSRVLSLPVLYVCENNQYSEYTPMEAVTPGGILARPQALEIPTARVDGQDVWEVRCAALDALKRIRAGEGPVFIEASTYRYSDHGRGDPIKYRPDEELRSWKERDPIDLCRGRLSSSDQLSDADVESVTGEVEELVQRIEQEALDADFPSPADLGTEYAGGVS